MIVLLPVNVTDSRFVSNAATVAGGAIAFFGPASVSSIIGSYFLRNTANIERDWRAKVGSGTADPFDVWTVGNQRATLTNYGGGAVFVQDIESFKIAGSVFSKNLAHQGGAIVVKGQTVASELSLAGCRLQANEANSSGGAVHVNIGGALILERNKFRENSAVAGGAIFLASGSKLSTSLPAGEELYFQNNSAVTGGAINCHECGKRL